MNIRNLNLKQLYQAFRIRKHGASALRGTVHLVALFFAMVLLMPTSVMANDEPTARIFSLDDFSRVAGAKGTIERSDTEICLGVVTRGLPPGAYTMWGIAFDSPGDCVYGGGMGNPPLPGVCGVGDDDVAATMATGQWMGAFLVGPDGRGHLSSCVELGAPRLAGFLQLLFGDGMDNPGAEIHGVIRSHGEALYDDPALLGYQLTNVLGGCNFGPPGPWNGPNADCEDMQLVIWPAAR